MSVAVVTPKALATFRRRYKNLAWFGLIDDRFAIAFVGAGKLGVRPCDVVILERTRDGTVVASGRIAPHE